MDTPLSFGELADRYEQGRANLAGALKSVLTPHPSLGNDTGRFVAIKNKTGDIVTFDRKGALYRMSRIKVGKRRGEKQTKNVSTSITAGAFVVVRPGVRSWR